VIARVLLPLPVDHPFDFTVTTSLEEDISIGKRVVVRFRGREQTGIVQSLEEKSLHPGPLEPVLHIKTGPSYDPATLKFCLDTAAYYLSPSGPFVNRLLPRTATTRRDTHLQVIGALSDITSKIQSLSKRAPRQAEVLRYLLTTDKGASEALLRKKLQTTASVINRLIELGLIERTQDKSTPHKGMILHDCPSLQEAHKVHKHTLLMSHNRISNYVKAIKPVLATSQSVLVLAPEILLARSISADLAKYLNAEIMLYHSGVPEGERGRIWQHVSKRSCVVVGTRSALFLPFSNLALVIIDEEQDRSYKQDEMMPYFNARDAALRTRAPNTILASIAPSVETFYHVEKGLFRLDHQPAASPKVTLIDMRKERGPLSNALIEAVAETLACGKRALIGVNARGHFQAVLCKQCGRPLVCPNCGANLTYDVQAAQLVCRVCGIAQTRMACANCGSRSLRFVGIGSERLQEEIGIRFPDAKVARIDRTSLASVKSLTQAEKCIEKEAQIIVGTALATKGPIIPNLGLVAAVGIDSILARPDFRAAERAYQYLAGLFARLDKAGTAIVQTSYPEHYAIVAAVTSDSDLFYHREIAEREAMFYPPFSHLARLIIPHDIDSGKLMEILKNHTVKLVGPAPHPRKHGRDVVLIKAENTEVLRQACVDVRENISSKHSKTKLEIDIDPDQI
jgi:primosomal protein N' (replication factor Y) (superfamily II helicase)